MIKKSVKISNTKKLTEGYYWVEDKIIYVTVTKDNGAYFGVQYVMPGTYYQWIGDECVYSINEFNDPPRKALKFIKIEKPK